MGFRRKSTRLQQRLSFLSVLGTLIFYQAIFTSGAALAVEPFKGFVGLWGGSGTVSYESGTKERLRCRVQYVQNDEDNLQLALSCASDSYKFQINSYLKHVSGVIRGRWEELTLEISGTVTGTAVAGRIDGLLHGPGFVARLVLTTTGTTQTIKILTPDQEIQRVDMKLRKAGG